MNKSAMQPLLRRANRFALAVWLLVLAGLTSPALAADAGDLSGTWAAKSDLGPIELVLRGDGTYTWTLDLGGTKIPESGSFGVEGDLVTLRPTDGQPRTFTISAGARGKMSFKSDVLVYEFNRTGDAPAGAPRANGPDALARSARGSGLEGAWQLKDAIQTITIHLRSDGLYALTTQYGDVPIDEVGHWSKEGSKLTLSKAGVPPAAAPAIPGVAAEQASRQYSTALDGDRLTLSGGGLPDGASWDLTRIESDAPPQPELPGRWRAKTGAMDVSILFYADGRYLRTMWLGGGNRANELGQFAMKDGALHLTSPEGNAGAYVVVPISRRTLLLAGPDTAAMAWRFDFTGRAPDAAAEARAVAGRWYHAEVGSSMLMVNAPDGKYTGHYETPGGESKDESGTWAARDGKLRFNVDGKEYVYTMALDGARLVLAGGAMATPTEFMPRPEPDPRAIDPLIGRWVCDLADLGFRSTIDFLPGARYRSVMTQRGAAPIAGHGTVAVSGDVLIFDEEGGEITDSPFQQKAGQLLMGPEGAVLAYSLQPDSRDLVIAEARAADEAKRRDDAEFAAKTPLAAPNGEAGAPVQIGEIPVDPNPRRLPAGNTKVFASLTAYQREWRNFATHYRVDGETPRSISTFYLFPNGRIYYRNDQKSVRVGSGNRGTVTSNVRESWGRYGIEVKPDGTEIMTWEPDGGGALRLEIRDGHRSLKWGRTYYSIIGAAAQ